MKFIRGGCPDLIAFILNIPYYCTMFRGVLFVEQSVYICTAAYNKNTFCFIPTFFGGPSLPLHWPFFIHHLSFNACKRPPSMSSRTARFTRSLQHSTHRTEHLPAASMIVKSNEAKRLHFCSLFPSLPYFIVPLHSCLRSVVNSPPSGCKRFLSVLNTNCALKT